MSRKSTLAIITLTITFLSLGCACNGSRLGYYSCKPCTVSYNCNPCGMSACEPAASCESAGCAPCSVAEPYEYEQACACEAVTGEYAYSRNSCSYGECDRQGGLLQSFGNHIKHVKPSRVIGNFGRGAYGAYGVSPDEIYVTRGPRDFFYDPAPMR